MPSINHLEPYTALADVYEGAGFAEYSANLAPRLLELGYKLEWIGRSLYDMACGTGEAAQWFAERGFRVAGVDSSPQMLRIAQSRAESGGLSIDYASGDIRTYTPNSQFEMVTCLGGSLNYIPTLRDLENVFQQAYAATSAGKWFVFDVYTIQGLMRYNDIDRVLVDNGNDIYIVARDSFNHETLSLTRQYNILRYTDRSSWQRAEEIHTLRGYPLQAIAKELTKTGFKVQHMLTTDFENAENRRDTDQVLFIASRES
jgi:SAM-dependent methyltransferase